MFGGEGSATMRLVGERKWGLCRRGYRGAAVNPFGYIGTKSKCLKVECLILDCVQV